MKMRPFLATLCALLLPLLPSAATPVLLNFDATFEGLGTSTQQPLATGVAELGWLDPGTTFADMTGFLTPGGPNFNVAAARDRFNSVATITFSPGSPNSAGGDGVVFESVTLVSDHVGNPAGFAAYTNPATGAAGKKMYLWIRNAANEGTASEQGFVRSVAGVFGNFPAAQDTTFFTDFETTFATDSFSVAPGDVGVGALEAVTPGGGIDTNGGSAADGMTLGGGLNVLVTEPFLTTPTLGFAPAAVSVQETAGSAGLTVTRAGQTAGTMTVNYTTANGTAVAGTDYTTTSGSLVFNPGETSKPIPVPILDRLGVQGARQFTVVLSGVTGGDIGAGTATVTINDEVRAGTLRLSSTVYTQAEGDVAGMLGITVQRVGGSDGALTGTLTLTDGTATSTGPGSDYDGGAITVSFAEFESADKTYLIDLFGDTVFEEDETFTATLTGTAVSAPTAATVTITNDDPLPTVGTLSFDNGGAFITQENAGTATVTVNRLAGSVGDTSVTYTVAGGSAVAGTDYDGTASPLTGTLSWVGPDTTPKSFQVHVIDNGQDAPDKTFQVTLSNPLNGALITGTNPATVTIADDDLPVTLSFDVAAEAVSETIRQVELVIQRGGSTAGSVSVVLKTSGLTAADYTPIVNRVITFADGQASQSVFVNIRNDRIYKGDRTFNATLFNPGGGATLGANPVEAITILEDDPPRPGIFTLSGVRYFGGEAGMPPQILVTVLRSRGSDTAVSVDYTLTQITATQGADYVGSGGTLNFAHRETRKVIAVPIIDDTEIEARETLGLALSNPTGGARLQRPTAARLFINDNDRVGTFSIEPPAQNVNEGATATVRVIRTGELEKTFTVNYQTVPGTASAGSDFVYTAGTLTFGPNVTELPVTIPTVSDQSTEGDETFSVVLSMPDSPPQTAVVSARSTARITINHGSDAILQPDNLVAAADGPFVGNDVYNTTGDGQIVSNTVGGSGTATFKLRVQNDGNVNDSLLVRGVNSGTANGTLVTYFRDGVDISAQVTGPDGYTVANLLPGSSVDIEVRVKFRGASALTGYGATITTSSKGTPSVTDTARVVAIVQ
jgi:hypothetical protein